RGTERHADSSPPASRQPRPERIAEKVELLVGIVSAPVIILAVHYLRLLGMKRQPTFSEPLGKRCEQPSRLRFTLAVADGIVGLTFEVDNGLLRASSTTTGALAPTLIGTCAGRCVPIALSA